MITTMMLTMTRASHILSLCEEVLNVDEDQILPYSTPGFQNPHPKKDQITQSAATRYAKKLRSIQRERFFRRAISASWKKSRVITPPLTPSERQGH